MANKLGDLVISIAADIAPLSHGLRSAARLVDGFAGSIKSIATSAAGVGLGVLGAGALGDLMSVPRDFVVDSVKAAAGIEKLGVQFEVLTGSARSARDLMSEVKDFAVESGMGLDKSADYAKQLLAAGVALKQVIPTLGVLGDVTMGDREKLGRAVLAYSQVRAAGNVQGDELNQLNELGIPVKQAIADAKGIGIEELAKAIESRQVSFRDLQAGLKALTSEGGTFYRMTAKGANTLDGDFGRLEDAISDVKREFGAAIVQEIGLRDMLHDGAKFAREMKDYINDLRPGLRFLGDTVKGVGHVIAEVVRHGPLFGEAFTMSLRTASPLLGDLLERITGGVRMLKDFKLDPRAVVTMARDIGLSLGRVVDHLIGSLGSGLGGIYEQHVKPIVDALKDAALTWQRVSELLKAPADMMDQWKRTGDIQKLKDAGQVPEMKEFVSGRVNQDGFGDLMAKLDKAANRNLTLKEIANPDLRLETENKQHFMKEYMKSLKLMREEQARAEYLFRYSPNLKEASSARADIEGLDKAIIGKIKDEIIPQAAKLGRGDGPFNYKGIDLKATNPAAPWSAERAMREASKTFEESLDKLLLKFDAKNNPLADPLRGGVAGLIGPVGLHDASAKRGAEPFKLDELKTQPAKLRGVDEVRLPTAAEFGSQQASELVARGQSGQGEGWARLAEINAQQLEILRKIEQGMKVGSGFKVPSLLNFPAW